MRIQIYDEEITGEVTLVRKTADTGLTFVGVRIFLASPDVLHNTVDDDDRSAITFWWEDGRSDQRSIVMGMLSEAHHVGTL